MNSKSRLGLSLSALALAGGLSFASNEAIAQTRRNVESGFTNLQPGEIMPGVQAKSNNPFDNGGRVNSTNQRAIQQKEGQNTSPGEVFNAFPNGERDARALQSFLNSQGFNPGEVDGQWGPSSQAALNRYERQRGLTPSSGFSIPKVTYEAVVNDMMKHRLELGLKLLNGKPALQVAYAAIFASRFGVDVRGTYGKEIQHVIATVGVQVGKNGVLKVSAAHLRKFEELYFSGVPNRVGTTLEQNAFGIEYTHKTDDYNALLQEIGGGIVYFDAKGKNLGKIADIIEDGYNVGEIRGAWTGGKRYDAFVKAAFKLHPNIRLDGTVGWYQAKEGNILDYVGKSSSGLTVSGKLNIRLDEQNGVYTLGRWDGDKRWSVGAGYERAIAPGVKGGIEYRYDNPVNGLPANHSVMARLSGKFSTGPDGITFGDGSKETKLPPLFNTQTREIVDSKGQKVQVVVPHDSLTFAYLNPVHRVDAERIMVGLTVTQKIERQNVATIKNKPVISSVTQNTVTCSGSIEDTDGVRNQMFELLSSTGVVLQRQSSCNFSGLTAGTQYSVRVVGEAYDARKKIWESAISEATSFNTLTGNSTPKANPDTSTTPYNTPVTLNVVANDIDLDGDNLTIHLNPTASNGLVSVSADKKSITFAPNMGFTGTATVNYTISDGKGGFSSSVWTITVQPLVNQPPKFSANLENGSLPKGQNIDVILPDATDPNGDTLTYSLTGLPPGLTFTPSTRKLSGTPTTVGVYTVTYKVSDGKGGEDSKTVTLTITPPAVNNPPVFGGTIPNQTGTVGIACNVPLPSASDSDGDTLTYTATGLPTGCSFDATNRKIVGNPTVAGVFNITYTVSDGKGGTDTKTFTYTINEAPDLIPNAFSFVDQNGVATNTVIESSSITVSGINTPTGISIIGGEYSINGGAWTNALGTVVNGQTVKVRLTSASSFGTTKSAVLTIGGVSDSFDVITVVDNPLSVAVPTAITPTSTGVTCTPGVASDTDGVYQQFIRIYSSASGGSLLIEQLSNGSYCNISGLLNPNTDYWIVTAASGKDPSGNPTAVVESNRVKFTTLAPANTAPTGMSGSKSFNYTDGGTFTFNLTDSETTDNNKLFIEFTKLPTYGEVFVNGVLAQTGVKYKKSDTFRYEVIDGSGFGGDDRFEWIGYDEQGLPTGNLSYDFTEIVDS